MVRGTCVGKIEKLRKCVTTSIYRIYIYIFSFLTRRRTTGKIKKTEKRVPRRTTYHNGQPSNG